MKVVQHPLTLNVNDIIPDETSNKEFHRHSSLLPNNIRCLVSGPSGSGKTYVTLGLLFHPKGLRFENVYVCSKSLFQPKFQLLKNVLDSIPECGYYTYSEIDEIIPPHEVKDHSVIIFDDIGFSKQGKISDYFSMGRHRNMSCFYLCQTYSKIPKQLVRDNANMCIIFPQDKLNLKHVYENNVFDMTFDNFLTVCQEAWKGEGRPFLTICHEFDSNDGRYRRNFDQYIIPEVSSKK